MLALKENRCYGLSGGKLSLGGNVSVFHVKLTDSAARAVGSFHSSKGCASHATICFSGNQGRITIPCSENSDEVRIFTFGVTHVARDNPHGSFDCIRHHGSGAAEELSCLGVIPKKMTVNATDDSYDKARQSLAQAEEETRSRGAIVIKNGARYQGKKVRVRAPAPALAKLTKPKHSSRPLLSSIKRGADMSKQRKGPSPKKTGEGVQERPLRERVMHLLALRPYKRPELILRLQKDGLTGGDKDGLDSVMMEVGQPSGRDRTFVLKDALFKELQKDWPGYSTGDQQLLKRILVRRLFQPQQNLLTVPEAQVSPLRDTPNSSPAHRPKLAPEDGTDSLVSRKPRISHLSSKTARDNSELKASRHTATLRETEVKADDGRGNSLDPKRLFDSLSAVCQQEAVAAKRLKPTGSAQQGPKGPGEPPQTDSDRPPSPLIVPDLSRRREKKKKSKHKHREHEKDECREQKERGSDHSAEATNDKDAQDCTELSESLFDSNVPQKETDTDDYLLKFTVICSHKQRQSYKEDFNQEYSEYRDLHARIDSVTQQFMELDTQLKQLHHDSHKYKTVRNKIFQEYRKIKKSNPNYNQDKARCEYLHNKLAHIKKLISDFDQQQLAADPDEPK
ncbi:RNA polymerase II elongation factor ELL [Nematolebias whitei]|uniref:RNA polymerase II elongation factor ELL n=1 Tax=Nematolebias whitei TaxID=451745 RepID=UPI001899D8F6|nr:RNA polymerase II elongation factor ELL [Nematolebias whitei]